MSQTEKSGARFDPEAHFNRLGGRVFALGVFAAAIFSAWLFELRADQLFTFPETLADAGGEDLTAFQRGAEMAAAGDGDAAYDPATFRDGLPEPAQGMLWLYPPHFFLLIAPLALASFGTVKAFWLIASGSALLSIARIAAPRSLLSSLLVVSPAAFAHLLAYQIGPFVALVLLGALLCARDRPTLSAILIALLTMKPQVGLLIPVFLAAGGDWRAFHRTVAFAAVLIIVSILSFGGDVWASFFAALKDVHGAHAGALHRDMISVQQTAAKLGAPAAVSIAAHLVGLIIAASAVWTAGRRLERDDAIGLTLLLSAAVSPSIWVYDWPLVAAGMLMLARNGPWPVGLQALGAIVWIGPLFSLGIGTLVSAVIAPISLYLFVGVLLRRLLSTARDAPQAERLRAADPVSLSA
ncbi:MAG: glycosyltransferase family 87 protein [Pseudomonadota bacterium]